MKILQSGLSHNEILQQTGIKVSKRQMSQARMGREPAYSSVVSLLQQVDTNIITSLDQEIDNMEIAQRIIDAAIELLSFVVDISNLDMYLTKYKVYIDMKVAYNKLGITPKNHDNLISLHQQVRRQHEEAKKMLEMPTAI